VAEPSGDVALHYSQHFGEYGYRYDNMLFLLHRSRRAGAEYYSFLRRNGIYRRGDILGHSRNSTFKELAQAAFAVHIK
jgi:hypothetical protein